MPVGCRLAGETMLSFKHLSLCGLAGLSVMSEREYPCGVLRKHVEWDLGTVKASVYEHDRLVLVAFHFRPLVWELTLAPLKEVHGCFSDASDAVGVNSSVYSVMRAVFSDGKVSEIMSAVRKHNRCGNVYFTGYNLGGMVAQLFSLFVVQQRSHVFQPIAVTFGKPITGNYAFAEYFNYRVLCCSNYIAKFDNILNYCHVKTKGSPVPSRLYNDGGVIVIDDGDVLQLEGPTDLSCHVPCYYYRCLLNLYRRNQSVSFSRWDRGLDAAVKAMGRFCRRHVTRNGLVVIVRRLRSHGLFEDGMRKNSTEKLVRILKLRMVVRDSKKFLERVLRLAIRARVKSGVNDEAMAKFKRMGGLNVNLFLSLFLIVISPQDCFVRMGDFERKISVAANVLLRRLTEIALAVSAPGFRHRVGKWFEWSDVVQLLCDFVCLFDQWSLPVVASSVGQGGAGVQKKPSAAARGGVQLSKNPEDLIRGNEVIMERVRFWIKGAVCELRASRMLGDASFVQRSDFVLRSVVTHAIACLVFHEKRLVRERFPPTLVKEFEVMKRLRVLYRFDCLCMAMQPLVSMRLKVIKSKEGSDLVQRVNGFLNGFDVLSKVDLNSATAEDRMKLVELAAEGVGKFLSFSERELVRRRLPGADSLLYLLEVPSNHLEEATRVVSSFWKRVVSSRNPGEGVSEAGGSGMAGLHQRIAANAGGLWKVVDSNLKLNYNLYQDLIDEVLRVKK